MLYKQALRACIAVLVLHVATSVAERSSYGEACNKTQRCERRSWLGCFSGICDCAKPEEMVFQLSTGKCASKSGERCKYALENSDVLESTDCVENSVCGEDGYCACNQDFHENTNGTCSSNGRWMDACDGQAKCNDTLGFVCNNGSCECQANSTYSEDEEQCIGLAGHACIASKCTENANCSNNECVCGENFYRSLEDECSVRKGITEHCTDDDQCKYEGGLLLKCIEGACACDPDNSLYGTARRHRKREESCTTKLVYRFGDNRFIQERHCTYDDSYLDLEAESKTQCLGKVGSSCIERMCALGTFCRYERGSGNFNGTCSCLPGYTRSSSGTCGVGYDQDCSTAGICLDGTVCSSGNHNRCKCRYSSQVYDQSLSKCISPVGGPCDGHSTCVKGAECQKFESSEQGICKCRPGHVEGASGTCEAEFGMSCSSTAPCDSIAGLACLEYTCQCSDFQQFNQNLQKCVGLVGSECDLKADDQCVEHSTCMKIRDGLNRAKCKCSAGFSVNRNYTCTATENVPVIASPAAYYVEASDEV